MMIEVRNLTVSYGKETALDAFDLSIEEGTTCAIIGPSGCGKTTLLYALAGLIAPDGGTIRIQGDQVTGIRRRTGIILQNKGIFPWKTVWENVALGLEIRNVLPKEVQRKTETILRELDIEDQWNKYPVQISGGQAQRVAIARTLVTDPDLLLLDEATSALDALTKEALQNLILEIYQRYPLTLVTVTHSIEEAVYLGKQIVIMENTAVKKVIKNPYFGVEMIRNQPEFHQMCTEVRRCLEEKSTR